MKKIVGYAMLVLPFISGFLWIAFDISWWTTTHVGKLMLLVWAHVLIPLAAPIFIMK